MRAIVDLECNAWEDELAGIGARVRAVILEGKYAGNEIAPGTKPPTESAVAIDYLCEQAVTSQFDPVDESLCLYLKQRWGRAVEDGAPRDLLPICDEPESPASHLRISPCAWRVQVSAPSCKDGQQDQQAGSHSHDSIWARRHADAVGCNEGSGRTAQERADGVGDLDRSSEGRHMSGIVQDRQFGFRQRFDEFPGSIEGHDLVERSVQNEGRL